MFEAQIFPVLTPLAVDPSHPFPYISNLSLNLAVQVRDPKTGDERFARVKVPPVLPRFLPLADETRFVPIEQVIAAHIDRLFPGMDILTNHPFRVTRDTDFELEDEDEDLLEAIEEVLHRRTKFGRVVRIEIDTTMPDAIREVLVRELEIDDGAVTVLDGPLDLGGLWGLYALDRPELKDETVGAADPPRARTRRRAHRSVPHAPAGRRARPAPLRLVHHVGRGLRGAGGAGPARPRDQADDLPHRRHRQPRSCGRSSTRPREGKQVVALVELKARFDEQANIERARVLEEAGVHVVYGLVGLKTHAKILLVVRQEDDGIRRYCHVGTGNYNPKTATLYEDLGLLTADPELGAELTELFNHLTGYSRPVRLPHAPRRAREPAPGLRERIRRPGRARARGTHRDEDEQPRRPRADRRPVRARRERGRRSTCSCAASAASGPRCRGCRRRSASARSWAGTSSTRASTASAPTRTTADWYIGSADLMPRNLDRRVEALAPVMDAATARAARRDPRHRAVRHRARVAAARRRHVDARAATATA